MSLTDHLDEALVNNSDVFSSLFKYPIKLIENSELLKKIHGKENDLNVKNYSICISIMLIFVIFRRMKTNLKKLIEQQYPDIKIQSIKKTNFNDLYEVYLGK